MSMKSLQFPYESPCSPKETSKKNKFFPDIFRIPLFSTSILSAKNNKQSFPSTLPRNLHGSPNFASNFPYEIPMVSPLPRRFSASFHKRKPSAAPTEPRPAWDCIEQGTHTMNYYDISGDISKL